MHDSREPEECLVELVQKIQASPPSPSVVVVGAFDQADKCNTGGGKVGGLVGFVIIAKYEGRRLSETESGYAVTLLQP